MDSLQVQIKNLYRQVNRLCLRYTHRYKKRLVDKAWLAEELARIHELIHQIEKVLF